MLKEHEMTDTNNLLKQVIAEAEENARVEQVLTEKFLPVFEAAKIIPIEWSEEMSYEELMKSLGIDHG